MHSDQRHRHPAEVKLENDRDEKLYKEVQAAEARYQEGLPAFGIHILPSPSPKHQEDIVQLLTSALVCAGAGKIEEVALTVRYTDGRVDTMWSNAKDRERLGAALIKAGIQCLGFTKE